MNLVQPVLQPVVATEKRTETSPLLIHIVGDSTAIGDAALQNFTDRGYQVLRYEHVQNFGELFAYNRAAPQCMIIVEQVRAGTVLQQRLKNAGIEMPIVYVIDRNSDVDAAVEAMKLGALDMLCMPCEAAALESVVTAALERETEARKQNAASQEVNGRLANLTQREHQVLELLVNAYSTKSIASRLNISPKTVFVHRARVLEKVGVDNLVELSLLVSNCRKN